MCSFCEQLKVKHLVVPGYMTKIQVNDIHKYNIMKDPQVKLVYYDLSGTSVSEINDYLIRIDKLAFDKQQSLGNKHAFCRTIFYNVN